MSHVARSVKSSRTWARDGFLVSTDSSMIPIDALNKAFASEAIYWASSLPEPAMREMLDNCLCFGLYSPTPAPPPSAHQAEDAISVSTPPDAAETLHEIAGHVKPESSSHATTAPVQTSNAGQQSQEQDQPSLIGFARLITDRVTFAYLTDVYTLPEWQGQGLGKWLISCVQEAVEGMPYLRRSMCIVGHGKEKGIDFYGGLMKMIPVEPPVTILTVPLSSFIFPVIYLGSSVKLGDPRVRISGDIDLRLCTAATPSWYWPELLEEPENEDLLETAKMIYQEAFEDAITLARVVVLAGSDCDPSFLRYFQPQDFEFVQAMFNQIASINVQESPRPEDVLPLLSTFDMDTTLSPVWSELSISCSDNPLIPEDLLRAGQKDCTTENVDAYCEYDPYAPRSDHEFQGSGYISLCPDSATFEWLLSLRQTENPPAWGREGGEPDGKPTRGFGCEEIMIRDTGYMKVVGATFLHEFFHWPRLFQDVPGYNIYIDNNNWLYPRIVDYKTNTITDSYGPWSCLQINQLPVDPLTGMSKSIQNADNYVWYALSLYWTWKCDLTSKDARSETDNNLFRARARGYPLDGFSAPDDPGY